MIEGFFGLFFFILFMAIVSNSLKRKYSNKLIDKITTGIMLLIFVSFFILAMNLNYDKGNNSGNNTADGFTIEGYEVILDVQKDNKIFVTENIDVNFYKYKHGIYKFTPLWLEYTGKNNKTIKRKAVLTNYKAVDEPYYIDSVKKKARIRLGSASEQIIGNKKYTIEYTYDMGKDPFKGFDEFIFHCFGDYWGTQIRNAKVVVHMPKGIDGYNVNFFTDKYRKENVNNKVKYQIDGNTLTAYYKDNSLTKSLTVDIELPENYFVGGSWNYGWTSFTISMIILLLTGIIIYLWSKYGKNYEKRVPTVEFYAPENLSSAEIGYIFNKYQSSKKLTISLIIQLASKGYIKIDDSKGNIIIHNLVARPKEVKDLTEIKLEKRIIAVKKIKDIDNDLNDHEKTMMKYLFKDYYIKNVDANIDKFLEVKDSLLTKGYIEIISDNEKEVEKKNQGILKQNANLIKEHDERMNKYLNDLEEYNQKIAVLPEKSAMENIVYSRLFESVDEIALNTHHNFYKTFDEIEKYLADHFQKKVYDIDAKRKKKTTFITAFLMLGLSLISFFVIEDLDPNMSILYYLSFACVIINFFFGFIMGRRTDYGEVIKARVLGFKDFLLTAEKEKLESLVEQNPHYFYDILPYTYVLNVSKKWVKKFENIPMPEVDMGTFDYFGGDSSINSISSNISYPISTSSGGSSGGCSSCGGGCSSCGGGCSSCGGGGSW